MRSSTSRLPLLFCGAALAAAAAVVAALTWVGGDDAPAPAAPRQATAAAAVDPLAQVRGADDRAEADERHGCLGAPTGSTFRYRLTDRSDFTLSSAEAGAHPGGRLHVECEVAVTVLDRRDGEVLVGERIDALRFVGSDGRPLHDADAVQRSLTTAAATPVFARLDQAGKVLGFGFADGLDGDQRNFLRGVLGVLHFPAPGSDHGEWRLHDSDTTGDYDARCEVVAATADEVLDVGELVALGVATAAGAGGEVDHDSGRAGVVGGVDAVAAVELVVAGIAAQQVVAIVAGEGVAAVATPQRVGLVAAAQHVVAAQAPDLVVAAARRHHEQVLAVATDHGDRAVGTGDDGHEERLLIDWRSLEHWLARSLERLARSLERSSGSATVRETTLAAPGYASCAVVGYQRSRVRSCSPALATACSAGGAGTPRARNVLEMTISTSDGHAGVVPAG